MDNKNRNSAYVTGQSAKKVTHFLPRVGAPIIQDLAKRGFSSPSVSYLTMSNGPMRAAQNNILRNLFEI